MNITAIVEDRIITATVDGTHVVGGGGDKLAYTLDAEWAEKAHLAVWFANGDHPEVVPIRGTSGEVPIPPVCPGNLRLTFDGWDDGDETHLLTERMARGIKLNRHGQHTFGRLEDEVNSTIAKLVKATEEAQEATKESKEQVAAAKAAESQREATFTAKMGAWGADVGAQVARAESAASTAEGAIADATTAKVIAEDAAATANAAASNADSKAQAAQSAASTAQAKATAAQTAADAANAAASRADTAKAGADAAAANANAKATAANAAAANANQAASDVRAAYATDKAAWQAEVDAASQEAQDAAQETREGYSAIQADYDQRTADWQAQIDGMIGDFLRYDDGAGEYVNIESWFYKRRDGRIFTVRIPHYEVSTSPTCVKMDDNAGLVVEASTAASAGRDDYQSFNAFSCPRVNGWVGDDGYPHVVAIEGDSRFDKRGIEVGGRFCDTWVLTPNLFWRWTDDGQYSYLSISDSPNAGFETQPGGLLVDGKRRPFILYAAYAGGIKDGKLVSAYGAELWNYWTGCGYPTSYSHDTSITLAHARGAGYAGKTQADCWYHQVMLLVKYATKNSQSVYYGCVAYTDQTPCAEASEGDYVVLTANDAAKYVVGSNVCVGTATSSPDRSAASAHDVVNLARILSKETLPSGNVALHLSAECSASVGNVVSTMPYRAGYTDAVQGVDGYVSDNSGKEPFRLQNIEQIVGAYEIASDTILVGSPEQEWWVCRDSAKYHSGSKTDDYERAGSYVGNPSGWSYGMDLVNAGGVLMPSGRQDSSGRGICDGYYLPAASTSQYEFRSVGYLYDWSFAGLFCVSGSRGLSGAAWYIAGRLSAIGRRG